jgi:hypothetical protein
MLSVIDRLWLNVEGGMLMNNDIAVDGEGRRFEGVAREPGRSIVFEESRHDTQAGAIQRRPERDSD